MKYLVTGGAGFVGSTVVDRLVHQGHDVIVYDNLSTGNLRFLENAKKHITFVKADLLDMKSLCKAMVGVDFVFHMAANADVKDNLKYPTKCLEQNTIATSNVLEAMRTCNVKRIAFASTGSIYGEPDVFPTPEDYHFPIQTSMYGASKLACEGLLQAYAVGYDFQVFIFRFVSLMGERYTHGCVFDFYQRLRENPKGLHMLGDGQQKKSYLYVQDCMDALFLAITKCKDNINIFNLGTPEYIQVMPIANIVCKELGLNDVKFTYSGGERGWVGDSPFILLDVKKMMALGWKPKLNIEQAVKKTINWLKNNQWVYDERT
ncbi:MAG: NAD-dependent epimerase/dehydratase family protein [archaeon]